MRVFVTGGTGFTGSHVVPILCQNGYQVRCLYRPTSDRSSLLFELENPDDVKTGNTRGERSLAPGLPDHAAPEIEWVQGDLSDSQGLSAAMTGFDTLVNLASLGFGHAEAILHATQKAGIRRAIFISTTAIFTQLNPRSKSVRLAAERAIETSGLQYTILRPTMIYGSRRDRNMWQLIRFMRVFPIVPVFGDGTYLQQPIYVEDVARAIVGCLQNDRTIGKSYNIAGKHPLTYNEVIDTIARQMNKRVWKLHLPSQPVVFLLRLFERWHVPFPIKAEQVLRLNENKTFSVEKAQRDFNFNPMSFEDGIFLELRAR